MELYLSLSHDIMKFFMFLAGLGLAAAKPQFGKDLSLAEGRIIGGSEAPKRN